MSTFTFDTSSPFLDLYNLIISKVLNIELLLKVEYFTKYYIPTFYLINILQVYDGTGLCQLEEAVIKIYG